MSGTTTHLHLTRRGRVVFTTLAAAPLVVGAIVLALNSGIAVAAGQGETLDARTVSSVSAVQPSAVQPSALQPSAAGFTYVTVHPGQSLWQLAQAIAPTADPRDVIAEIVNLNQLASEDVQPGQRLALPEQY